jgi:hypothetical protein
MTTKLCALAHRLSTMFGLAAGRWRGGVALLLIVAVLASYAPAQAATRRQSAPTGQYTVGDCRNVDKEVLRSEIERHALDVIAGAAAPLNIEQLVARKWAELRVDAVIDAAVSQATTDLYAQEDYFNRLASGWWGDKAQEYAERVANTAFSSPQFRAKIEELSAAVGVEVARQVETQFAQAASVALLCLREYVGEHYAETLFAAFEHSVQLEMQQLNLTTEGAPEINALASHQLALAGVGTILVTQLVYRLTQRLSERIAQRVAGKIAGRILGRVGSSFIPVAGWIIGIGLIVYDLWEGGNGALPQIEEALTSPEVKAKIQEEIVTAIKDDLPDQAAWIALETSVSLVEEWQQFCSRYQDVCATAESNVDFGNLLELVTLDELDRLDALTTYLLNQAGRATLDIVTADGRLEQLLALPDATLRELMAWSTPAALLAWQGMVGAQLPLLVDYGVHRQSTPEEFTPATLTALLALPGSAEAEKVLALAAEKRRVLLALPQDVLDQLAAVQTTADLDWLAGYMLLSQAPPAAVAEEVAEGRTSVAALRDPQQAGAPATGSVSTAAAVALSTTAPEGLPAAAENGTIPFLIILLLATLVVGGGAGGYWYWRRRSAASTPDANDTGKT